MITRQAIPLALLGAGILSFAAGCDRDADGGAGAEAESAEVEQGGTAVIADIADINIPIAILAGGGLDGNLASDVLGAELLRTTWDDGRLEYQTAEESPHALARSFEYLGADSSDLRFHMRSDMKWSDGRPITARDIVFTYQLLQDPTLASPHVDYVAQLDSVTAQNDSTVTFFFRRRYPDMLAHSSMAPLPSHTFQGVTAADFRNHPAVLDPSNGKLPTSGAFMIGPWQRGQSVTLIRNPHFQPRANLEQVVFRVIPDPTTRVVEMQTGGVDFIQNVPSDQIATLRAQEGIGFEAEEKRFYDYIAYNPETVPAFADREVRRALGLALNVPQMLQALGMAEFAVPAGGPYSPIFTDLYRESETPPLPYDPEEARRILDARGWRDADGDGIREKDGTPLRFTLVTNAGNQRRADVQQIAQQQWKQIGVDAQIQQLEFNTYMQDVVFGRKYEAALGGWQIGLSPEYLATHWGPDTPFNLAGYQDAETAALIERARAQATAEAAAPFWRQAAARIAQAQPYTFLYYMDGVDAVGPRLRGVEIDSYGAYENLHEWWIPTSQRRPGATAPDSAAP